MKQLEVTATGIDAVHYLAKDFQRAVAFYRDVFGLPVAVARQNSVEFQLPDGNTFGVSYMAGAWYPCGGVMFAVDDVHAVVERARAAGARVLTGGAIETHNCTVAWCEDTEGNNFAVHRRK